MREATEALPTALEAEGIEVKGAEWGGMIAGSLRFAKGADFKPVLEGLPHDHCQCPHWGYVIDGEIIVDYQDGANEVVRAGELYYWPPGHTIRFPVDTRYVEFSPAAEMAQVLAHVKAKMGVA